MKLIFLLLLSLCCLSSAQSSPDTLVIGSWNIENLDGERRQEPVKLARHLRQTGADVLALQEVYDSGPGLSNPRLQKVLDELNKTPGQAWTYRLFPNKPPNEKARLCGVAWNQKMVEPVGDSWRIDIKDDPTDPYPIWHRHPQATKFRAIGQGRTDFVLISIHMKSNRRPKKKGEFFTRMQRAEESRTLVKQLPALRKRFSDNDIVIVGDTNCLDVNEPALQNYRNAGFRDLNLGDLNTHIKGEAPFDRFFVPQNEPEFEHSRQMVLTPTDPRGYEADCSDHLTILTVVSVMQDDD